MRAVRILTVSAALLVVSGCGNGDQIARMRVEVVAVHPHDRTAFTEGLEVHDGVLLEGTGLDGHSAVRATDLASGDPIAGVDLPPTLFGEGITVAGDSLWQLTWQDRVAIERDPRTLAERRRVSFVGEGWGVCAQPDRLVLSDGSSTLTFRDPVSFERVGSIALTGRKTARLNELDCAADGSLYANAWPTDHVLHIDPSTGTVLADIDAGELRDKLVDPGNIDVLNGIAGIPGTDRFLLTGKYWPSVFEVRFVS